MNPRWAEELASSARIVNVEYKSEDREKAYLDKSNEWCPKIMPAYENCIIIDTGLKPTFLIPVYFTEEIAENAGEQA